MDQSIEDQKKTESIEISIFDIFQALKIKKNLVISLTFIGLILGTITSFSLTPLYTSDLLMISSVKSENNTSELGGLASLAGFNIKTEQSGKATPLAVLNSRTYKKHFLNQFKIKPFLFPDEWDKDKKSWRIKEPSDLSAVSALSDLILIKKNEVGLITLNVTSVSPQYSRDIANQMIFHLNNFMRADAIKEAEDSIIFLTEQLKENSLSGIQQRIYSLIENNLQDKTLANVKEDFAFDVIDKAELQTSSSYPNRLQIQLIGLILGLILGSFVANYLYFYRSN